MYRIYQLIIFAPIFLLSSIWAGSSVALSCIVTGWLKEHLPFSLGIFTRPDWWATTVSRIWSKIVIRTALLPVEVKGKGNIPKGKSCVFVANHQGAFDIFLVSGYSGIEIRWMLKRSLEKIPFIGAACRHAGYIFVDKGNAGKVRATYRRAEKALAGGASVMVFPEGARTFDGAMTNFRRGAFTLADELQLPVVPMTINGSFIVMPRQRDGKFLTHHKLSLTIHKPIYPNSQGAENIQRLSTESYQAIASALKK